MTGYPEVDDPAVLHAVVEWARRGAPARDVVLGVRKLPDGVSRDSVVRAVAVGARVLRAHEALCPPPNPGSCWGSVRDVAGDELIRIREIGTESGRLPTAVERALWETRHPDSDPHGRCARSISRLRQSLRQSELEADSLRRQRDEHQQQLEELRQRLPQVGESRKWRFRCEVCGRQYKKEGTLMNHTIIKHNGDGRRPRRDGEAPGQATPPQS